MIEKRTDDELLRECVLGEDCEEFTEEEKALGGARGGGMNLPPGYVDATSDDEVEVDEWRDLSEFFPVRYDKERGCHVYYDNRLSREKRVGHVVNESRNMPCYCGSGRKYKKCCLAKDKRGETWGECQVEKEEQTWHLEKI